VFQGDLDRSATSSSASPDIAECPPQDNCCFAGQAFKPKCWRSLRFVWRLQPRLKNRTHDIGDWLGGKWIGSHGLGASIGRPLDLAHCKFNWIWIGHGLPFAIRSGPSAGSKSRALFPSLLRPLNTNSPLSVITTSPGTRLSSLRMTSDRRRASSS